jgi:hypothetical protein
MILSTCIEVQNVIEESCKYKLTDPTLNVLLCKMYMILLSDYEPCVF